MMEDPRYAQGGELDPAMDPPGDAQLEQWARQHVDRVSQRLGGDRVERSAQLCRYLSYVSDAIAIRLARPKPAESHHTATLDGGRS